MREEKNLCHPFHRSLVFMCAALTAYNGEPGTQLSSRSHPPSLLSSLLPYLPSLFPSLPPLSFFLLSLIPYSSFSLLSTLLILCSSAPIEMLTLYLNIPWMLVIDDFRQGLLISSLFFFWIVFVGEHTAVSHVTST